MKEGKSIQHATEASLSAAVHFKFANWLDALEITAAQEIPICALQASLPTNTIQFNSRIQSFDAQSLSLSLSSLVRTKRVSLWFGRRAARREPLHIFASFAKSFTKVEARASKEVI